MRRLAVGFALVLLVAGGVAVAAELRDFYGKVVAAGGGRLTVVGRAGDERSFVRTDATRVEGRRKSWGALRPGDTVVVAWSIEDDPVAARRVRVVSTASD